MLYYYFANIFFALLGKIEDISDAFAASITAIKKSKLVTKRVKGFNLWIELDDMGMCIAPNPDEGDAGSKVQLRPAEIEVSLSAGLTPWLLNALDIPCSCGGDNDECPRCEGSGTAKDRYAIKQPALPVERERTTVIAILLDSVRNLIKQGKYSYMVFVPKGNPTMFLCTISAMEELVGDSSDGKALKRATYFAGYSLFENTSDSQRVRIAILKEEDWFNGQLQWNVEMALGLECHAIRLLTRTILKGSARTIADIQVKWAKMLLGITADVDGIATHEFVKRADSADIVEDYENYYVIEIDVADLMIVNPPLKPGYPGLGLSLWKYGKLGTIMNKIVAAGTKQLNCIKLLKEAMAGIYDSECHVLAVKMPQEGDDSFKSSFNFPIPSFKDGKFEWRNPKDPQSWASMWKRFYRYLMNNILRIEVDGLKSIVASCDFALDSYEEMYHLNHPDEQVAFAILPDEPVRGVNGKISMVDAILDTLKGFIMLKNPASSIRQFITLTPVGEYDMLKFLLTGIAEKTDLGENNMPILCGKGAVIVSSTTMQYRMCVQDFDGDQPVLLYVDANSCPPVPAPVDWVAEFVTKDSSKKVSLTAEQEKLEYYADMMLTIVAARQAIAPMVLGSLAGYIEMVVRAFTDGRLAKFSIAGWDGIQRLLSAIAEIYAIKKEKSMADSADKKHGWLWVDMFLELYTEGKEMIPLFRKSSLPERKRANLIRSLIRPSGETVIEGDAGDLQTIPSNDPYDILKTLSRNARLGQSIPTQLLEYFPALNLTLQFHDVPMQIKRRQWVSTKAERMVDMTSDVQIQQHIFTKVLECHMLCKNLTKVSGIYIAMDKAAREFITEIREGIREVAMTFPDGDDSIEKIEMIRESQAFAIRIMVEAGICELNEERPWIAGKGSESDLEFLFALLVGIRDMSYISRTRDGERVIEDGRKSAFNKCTAEGVRRCILGYISAIESSLVKEFNGSDDETVIGDMSSYKAPFWIGENEVEQWRCIGTDMSSIETL